MQSQSEFVPKTYGATPFDQFLEWEELPVIRNFVVSDIRKLEVMPWRRRGGQGCYIILGHPKEPPNSAAYVCEIPPGESLKPQKQMFEEMIFVLKGRGATSLLARQRQKADLRVARTFDVFNPVKRMAPTFQRARRGHRTLHRLHQRAVGFQSVPQL